jgi:hypothetical protein
MPTTNKRFTFSFTHNKKVGKADFKLQSIATADVIELLYNMPFSKVYSAR